VTESGAIPLAIELGARSVDHLEATGDDGVRALAASDVVAVVLPASALFLGRPMPPARGLVDAGAALALATDFNPGSAFCESLPLCCSLAATQLKLAPAEARSNGAKPAAKKGAPPPRSRRRTPQPPSWQRAGRRALILGAVVFVLFGMLNKTHNYTGAAVAALIYTALFIPFTYTLDR